MKKMKINYKQIVSGLIVGIVMVGFLGVISAVAENIDRPVQIENRDGGIVNITVQSEDTLGEMIFGGTTNLNTLELSDNLTVTKATTLSGTTTLAVNTLARLEFALTNSGTSSAQTDVDEMTIGGYCNTGAPVLVNHWWIGWDDSGVQNYGYDLTIGTTTCTVADTAASSCGTQTISWTNTTTATLGTLSTNTTTDQRLNTTRDVFNYFDRDTINRGAIFGPRVIANGLEVGLVTTTVGTFYDSSAQYTTTTPFLLGNNDCIIVGLGDPGVTSSDNLTSKSGKFYAETISR